ncbi:hypothetical protein C0Q70_01647 [Pomacea canaliculata]|uniref:Uncharacterized protein n=1 Tax=Pomacea canaliculata TaxID=400727 RepID=A0A2T7Q047_POMCA|nr:hypothetical protein C0Q70_01647 [Pomacea canaliculata]
MILEKLSATISCQSCGSLCDCCWCCEKPKKEGKVRRLDIQHPIITNEPPPAAQHQQQQQRLDSSSSYADSVRSFRERVDSDNHSRTDSVSSVSADSVSGTIGGGGGCCKAPHHTCH